MDPDLRYMDFYQHQHQQHHYQYHLVPPNISLFVASSYDHRQIGAERSATSSPSHMYEFKWLFLLVIELLVFLGNAFLILLIICNKNLYTNNTTRIVLSLGITDLLLSILVLPFTLYSHVSPHTWDLGFGTCFLWLSSDLQLTTTSILHLCSISYERYLSVASPLKFRKNMKLRIVYLIATSWLLSFFTCTLPFMLLSLWDRSFIYQESKSAVSGQAFSSTGKRYVCNYFSRKYLAYGTLITFWSPLVFMIFFGMRTMFLIRKIDRMHMNMSTKSKTNRAIIRLGKARDPKPAKPNNNDHAVASHDEEKSNSSNGQPSTKPAGQNNKCDASSSCRPKKSLKKKNSIQAAVKEEHETPVERERKFINQLVMANHKSNYILPLVDEIEQLNPRRKKGSLDYRNPRIMIRRRTHCGSGNIYELYYQPSKTTSLSKLRTIYSGIPSFPMADHQEGEEETHELDSFTHSSPTQMGSPTETTFQMTESQDRNSVTMTTSLIEKVANQQTANGPETLDQQADSQQKAADDTSKPENTPLVVAAAVGQDAASTRGSLNSLGSPGSQPPTAATLSWQRVRVKLAKHRRINNGKNNFSTRKELQAQKTLSIVLIVFLLSYFPLFTFISITAFTTEPADLNANATTDRFDTMSLQLLNDTNTRLEIPAAGDTEASSFFIDLDLVFIFLTWLAYTSGGVNPCLHLLLNNNFKLACKACFKLDKKKILVK